MARYISGKVTSAKTAKTIVVTVTRRKTHPLYKKQYSVNTKYMAHDEKSQAQTGDKVIIRETRPLSARKRFTLDKIVERSDTVFQEADAEAGVEETIRPKEKKTEDSRPKTLKKTTKEKVVSEEQK